MSTVSEIQQAIFNLSRAEFDQIIDWLYKLEEEAWDRRIEADSAAGKLNSLKAEAEIARKKGVLENL